MLRPDSGESRRSILSAAVVIATAALTAACTGGSSSGGPGPSPTTPVPTTTSATPDTLGQDATASLHGLATIALGQSTPVAVTATRSDPVTLQISASGADSVQLSMRSSGGDLFSLDGAARAGATVTDAHVAILLAASGVLVDTQSGNPCSTSYDVVSETAVSGTVRCQSLSGQQKVPVVVHFTAHG